MCSHSSGKTFSRWSSHGPALSLLPLLLGTGGRYRLKHDAPGSETHAPFAMSLSRIRGGEPGAHVACSTPRLRWSLLAAPRPKRPLIVLGGHMSWVGR